MADKFQSLAPYAALFAASAYLFHEAGAFASAARPGQLGPDFWPRAVLVLLMIVCGFAIVRRALVTRPGDVPEAADHGEAAPVGPNTVRRHPWLLAAGIALTIAYVLALDWLGFFVATALYLGLFMLVGCYRRARVIVASSVLGSLAFVYVFMKIVYVSLPLGRGLFKTLSVWLLALLGVH